MIKEFFNTLFDPWKAAKEEDNDKKIPGYVNQHWFIKGFKYFLGKSILNGGAQFILFIIQIIFIITSYFTNTLLLLFGTIFTAYLQFYSNSLVTTFNRNRHKALCRGLINHSHLENGKPPNRVELNKFMCNTNKK